MLYEISEKVIRLQNEGKKIIKLNVGDPDQDTHKEIIKESSYAMGKGRTKYGSASGEKKLRDELAEMKKTKPENVIITPGSKWAIYSIMHLTTRGKGNVIIPSPHWTSYELIAKDVGTEPRILKTKLEDDWKIDVNKLENMIDKETTLIVLNNPNNPTSKVIDDKTIEDIVKIANDKNVKVLSDETYSDISFVKSKSILEVDPNHYYVNSFSKTFAMTGWRLGYAIVDKELANRMTKLNQITITNVPMFVQDAASKALELKDEISKKTREVYKERVGLACGILSESDLKFSRPDAPFYVFPYCARDSEQLAFDLLDKGVAIAPGTAFGDYREFFRISLTSPNAEIKKGLEMIVDALK